MEQTVEQIVLEPGLIFDGKSIYRTSTPKVKKRRKITREPPSQKDDVFLVARHKKWMNVRVVGHGGMVDKPTKTNGWIAREFSDFKKQFPKAIIPQEALDRMKTLDSLVDLKGWLIADDERHPRNQPKPVHYDPMLIAVTKDTGEWICCYEWFD